MVRLSRTTLCIFHRVIRRNTFARSVYLSFWRTCRARELPAHLSLSLAARVLVRMYIKLNGRALSRAPVYITIITSSGIALRTNIRCPEGIIAIVRYAIISYSPVIICPTMRKRLLSSSQQCKFINIVIIFIITPRKYC